MALHKTTDGGVVSVAGDDYRWSVRRAPQWSAAHGWVGLVITVLPVEDPRSELVIEYPMPADWTPVGPMNRRIKRPPVVNTDFELQIARALAAGWDPGAKGRPFVFLTAEGRRATRGE